METSILSALPKFINANEVEQVKAKQVIELLHGLPISEAKNILRIASNYTYQIASKNEELVSL